MRKTIGSERGFSLVDVVMGMLVLSIVGIGLLYALRTAIMGANEVNVRATGRSLATAQMERIQAVTYSAAPPNGVADYTPVAPIPAGFALYTLDRGNNVVPGIYGIPWSVSNNLTLTSDSNIQKVTVIVQSKQEINSQGAYKEILRVTDFKVNR
jgi:Tfp pilus assembly protein PilV